MTSHSNRNLRRRLLARGISRRYIPQTRLAQLTAYATGITLLFGLLLLALRTFGGSEGAISFAQWWFTATRVVTVLLLFALLVRWVRQRFLWSLRRRLLVTYFFIGVIPIVLLVVLAGTAFYSIGNQYAASVVTADLHGELDSLRVGTNMLAGEAAGAKMAAALPASAAWQTFHTEFPNTEIALWEGDAAVPVFAAPATSTISRPDWSHDDREVIVNDNGKLYLRVVKHLRRGNLPAMLVASEPIDRALLDRTAHTTGLVRFSDSGNVDFNVDDASSPATPTPEAPARQRQHRPRIVLSPVEGGSLPKPAFSWDTERTFGSVFGVTDWENGQTGAALLQVRTRGSVLYSRLFRGLAGWGTLFAIFIGAIAIAFAIIELVALSLGLGLSRTITKSISNLYRATLQIKGGDFSHRIQVEGRDQLAELQRSFNAMTEDIERLILEQKEKERLQGELAIAQEVQDQLFPHAAPGLPTLEVHGVCKPARTVSGDYYDFLPFGEGKLGIAVGDISGKGISAALMMATVHSAVRAYERLGRAALPAFRQAAAVPGGESAALMAHATQSPASALALLNRHLYETTPLEKYATLFLGIYEESDRTLTYSNAGHLPPYIVSAEGSVRKLDAAAGLMVGLFDQPKYEDAHIVLEPGDVFVAFSDGVIEPENDFGEFGTGRLLEIVRAHRSEPLARTSEAVIQAVQDWIGAGEQPDDITLVLARAR
ncbi:MAG: SpoIIE family protein phosphatase [Candidatus Koribacter versatilis]|uniref:SpoIIE family protein phosphatase n=1 Tax=Candidatus Korobacter versatilis TaxID=658062 RepID=A0A932A691_9BACT|nr:SpoIIE family protein phosphatase [Candidatus Koribacter versatilis]